jgi:dTDP-glucose 4,6-dehydratase
MTELGWQPRMTLREGLDRTVDWYLNNEDWWRPLLDQSGVATRVGIAR